MCLHFSSVKQAGLTAVFKSQKHEVNARQAVRCSGGVIPETTVVHGTVSPVDSVHGENLDELLPDAQGRRPQLKLTHPACGRPPVRGEGNADDVSSRHLRLYPRRGLSTFLHAEASLYQDHKTPWPGTVAEPSTTSPSSPPLLGRSSFSRLPGTTIQRVTEQLVLPRATRLFHLVVGLGGATLSPAAAS